MLKAKFNFKCNGLSKKQGDSLNEEELKKISDFKDQLLKDGILEEEKKELKEEPKAEKKVTRKKRTKKKIEG